MKRHLIGLLLAFVFGPVSLLAQIPAQSQSAPVKTGFPAEGKEFWVVFQKNFRDFTMDEITQALKPAEPLSLKLFISAAGNAGGYVEIPGIKFRKEFKVKAGSTSIVEIDTGAQLRSSEKIESLGVHVVADSQVTVSGLSTRFQTTDTYLAFPVDILGKQYRVMCYSWLASDLVAQFAVVATQDRTTVRITPSVETREKRTKAVPFEIVLNRGETYQVMSRYDPTTSSDLTGSSVEADRPIALFSGHNCAYVPSTSVKACNMLAEQLPPVDTWGRRFVVGRMADRSGSVVRVLASVDSTLVYENERLVRTLQAGQFYENTHMTQNTIFRSNNPILVAQFSKGYSSGDSVGDPMMMVMTPVEHYLPSHRFVTPIEGTWNHFVSISVPTKAVGSLLVSGVRVDPKNFTPVGDSTFSVGAIKIPFGLHTVQCDAPVGICNYGFGYDEMSYDAYGNGGAFRAFRRDGR